LSSPKTPRATARIEHPVQRRVGECGVELAEAERLLSKVERLRVGQERVDAARAGRFHHLGRGVQADRLGAELLDPPW
jgi:hypothetical protein